MLNYFRFLTATAVNRNLRVVVSDTRKSVWDEEMARLPDTVFIIRRVSANN